MNSDIEEQPKGEYVRADMYHENEIEKIEEPIEIKTEKLFSSNLIRCDGPYTRIKKQKEVSSESEEEIEETKDEKKKSKEEKKKEIGPNSANKVLTWMQKERVLSNQIKKIESIVLSSNGRIAFFVAQGNSNLFCVNLKKKELLCNFFNTTKSFF